MGHYDDLYPKISGYTDVITQDIESDSISDPVNHPKHYTAFPGVEVIQITEHLNFCRGNAVKYICRAGLKGNELQDLEKALWYLQREINRLKGNKDNA